VIFKVSASHDHKRSLPSNETALSFLIKRFPNIHFPLEQDKGFLQIGPPPVKGAGFCARETLDGKDRSGSFALEENGAGCKTV
jgi:hypothetical protein